MSRKGKISFKDNSGFQVGQLDEYCANYKDRELEKSLEESMNSIWGLFLLKYSGNV